MSSTIIYAAGITLGGATANQERTETQSDRRVVLEAVACARRACRSFWSRLCADACQPCGITCDRRYCCVSFSQLGEVSGIRGKSVVPEISTRVTAPLNGALTIFMKIMAINSSGEDLNPERGPANKPKLLQIDR